MQHAGDREEEEIIRFAREGITTTVADFEHHLQAAVDPPVQALGLGRAKLKPAREAVADDPGRAGISTAAAVAIEEVVQRD